MKTRWYLLKVLTVVIGLWVCPRPAGAYYDPSLARWINRDPIAEKGGVNLHRFAGNGPNEHVDVYGRYCLRINLCILTDTQSIAQPADKCCSAGYVTLNCVYDCIRIVQDGCSEPFPDTPFTKSCFNGPHCLSRANIYCDFVLVDVYVEGGGVQSNELSCSPWDFVVQ